MDIDIQKIKVGDRLICLSMKAGNVVPVEHIVTKIEWLDMFGIRTDLNKEVEILGASIMEHKPHDIENLNEVNFNG